MAANPELDNILSLRIQAVADIRSMAQHYLMPEKPAPDPKNANIETPAFVAKIADATAAVEVLCSLMNVFGVMAGLKNYSGESAIADLTFSLNTNTFWIKNAQHLMPVVSAAINAFQDNVKLKANPQPLWKGLEHHNQNVWLEVLPAILFCLKGYAAMRDKSLEMKQAFEKFLRTS